MSKKIVSILLAIVMAVSMFCVASFSSSATTGKVYFEVPASWGTPGKVFCHAWNNSTGEGTSWQTKAEKMTKESDGKYSYELTTDCDMVIFSADSGAQTYDMTMGDACIGDTAYVTGTVLENPVDSTKTCEEAKWKGTTDFGPHFAITSIGNIIEGSLLPSEKPAEIAAKYIDTYANNAVSPATKDTVANVLTALKVSKNDVFKAWEGLYPDDASKYLAQADQVKDLLGGLDEETPAASGDSSSNTSSSGGTTSSKKTSSTTSSSTSSTGATTTGDATPYVALALILVAALGVAIIARKKAQ